MIYKAKIKHFSDIIDEEVVVEINGIDFYCFSNFHSPDMKVGETYPAELELNIFEELRIVELDVPVKEVCRIGETFSYILKGFLKNGVLDAGISVELDPNDLIDCWDLDGKYVEVSGIDRIGIDFSI